MVPFQQPSLLIGKVWVSVMHFCACQINCIVLWRLGGGYRIVQIMSVQPSIGSTVREFSISSVLLGLECSVLSISTHNRSQHITLDGLCKLINVVSGVPQGSALGPLLIIQFT